MFLRLILITGLIVLSASVSIACSCADPSVREKFRNSKAVFIGEVTSFQPLEKGLYEDPFYYKVAFKVEKQWKGKKQPEITALADFDSPGMCNDLDLKVGQKFLIYAPMKKGSYLIYRDCGPNRTLKSADEELKKLNSLWYRLFTGFYPYPKF